MSHLRLVPAARQRPILPTGRLRELLADQGYLVLPGLVEPSVIDPLQRAVVAEFVRASRKGRLPAGEYAMNGHLNCFPGQAARAVYDALERQGVIDLVRSSSPFPLKSPNVGCTLNLPDSLAQNEHIDGVASTPFLVLNVAMVDTSLEHGALEIFPRTHRKISTYWQLLYCRPERLRQSLAQGDVLIRSSMLWHRSMPNRTQQPTPMLAFSWENGASELADPFQAHRGQITFLPDRERPDWSGRLRERVYVTAPLLGTALRIAESLLQGRS